MSQEFERYFREQRQVFFEVDEEYSEKLAKEYDTKQNMCHYNTWQIKLIQPELDRYIGFVLLGDEVAVHSWLVDENDKILDPTLILDKKYLGEEYIGVLNNGMRLFE